jgi:hypothetical protein
VEHPIIPERPEEEERCRRNGRLGPADSELGIEHYLRWTHVILDYVAFAMSTGDKPGRDVAGSHRHLKAASSGQYSVAHPTMMTWRVRSVVGDDPMAKLDKCPDVQMSHSNIETRRQYTQSSECA